MPDAMEGTSTKSNAVDAEMAINGEERMLMIPL